MLFRSLDELSVVLLVEVGVSDGVVLVVEVEDGVLVVEVLVGVSSGVVDEGVDEGVEDGVVSTMELELVGVSTGVEDVEVGVSAGVSLGVVTLEDILAKLEVRPPESCLR